MKRTGSSFVLHLDESLRERYLGLGGLICRAEAAADISEAWSALKTETMKIPASAELKWNLPSADRRNMGITVGTEWDKQSNRADAMVKRIQEAEVWAICDVLCDVRRHVNRNALDFYKDGLKWLLDRFVNFLRNQGKASGPHFVVADQPSPAQEIRDQFDAMDPALEWVDQRERIWYDIYEGLFWNGFRYTAVNLPNLKDAGFYPSLLVSDSKTNAMLQMSDVVVGATTQCVQQNLSKCEKPQPPITKRIPFRRTTYKMRDQLGDISMPHLWTKFRGYKGKVIPYGFKVFPEETPAWPELREKMQQWG